MLNEYQINMLPERICERLAGINTEYLEIIGNLIKEVGTLRPTDVHRLQRMYDTGADLHRISLMLAEVSDKNVQDIYDAFDIVARDNYEYSRPFFEAQAMQFIPYEENESLQKYVKSVAKQTANEYINLTQHTAFAVFDPGGKSIAPLFAKNKDKVATSLSDTYTKIMDYAVTKVQLGKTDYQSAMREVQKAMVNSGIKTVDYASGYKRRLDTAVRQNVLWGLKECNQNTADMIGEEFGADGYEVSYHSNPRPSHADMGGRQYAKGEARTVNGVYYPSFEKEAEPLLNEYGCLHFKFSILLGISRPTYSNEQLEQMKAEDKQTFEFEGKEYTRYEASQLQRKIETAVRHEKDLANMAKASGNDDLRREAQYKINLLTSKYAQLSKASGLPTKMERMQVGGFRRVKTESTPSGVAKHKAIDNQVSDAKQYKKYINALGSENMPKTLDEFQKIKYNDIEQWEDIKYYVRHAGEKPIEYIQIDRELIKKGINKKGRAYPVENINITAWNKHAKDRLSEAKLTKENAIEFKSKAIAMMRRFPKPNTQWNYYSDDGVIGIRHSDGIVCTIIDKERFKDETIEILKVMKKWVK